MGGAGGGRWPGRGRLEGEVDDDGGGGGGSQASILPGSLLGPLALGRWGWLGALMALSSASAQRLGGGVGQGYDVDRQADRPGPRPPQRKANS